jgi:hypothetical protein
MRATDVTFRDSRIFSWLRKHNSSASQLKNVGRFVFFFVFLLIVCLSSDKRYYGYLYID